MIMKKKYMKPTVDVVLLQNKPMLLQASQASSNLAPEDDITIIDPNPAGTGFFGR